MQINESLSFLQTRLFLPEPALIRYYLICTTVPALSSEPGSVYSLLCILSRRRQPDETAFFYDVSRSRADAEAFRRILWESAVLPCAVGDILEDWLSDPDYLPPG